MDVSELYETLKGNQHNTDTITFFKFIYDRLLLDGENINVDYMLNLKERIEEFEKVLAKAEMENEQSKVKSMG